MGIIISNKIIDNYARPFIIAEIGANHNGEIELAKKLIFEAHKIGADAVKFQSWNESSLISDYEYKRNTHYEGSRRKHFGSLKQMVQRYQLSKEDHYELKKYCDEIGILFSSTPFSKAEVDLLEELNVQFYKIASMDVDNLELLKYVANKQKPIVLSTGMSSIAEIETAVRIIESVGNRNIVINHCVSLYPPDNKLVNLRNISMLQTLFPNYPIGFSDHTLGSSVSIASVALGAALIEKHFTLDKKLPGWDHEISSDVEEFGFIINSAIKIWESMGSFERLVSIEEDEKKLKFRRSIVINKDMKLGEKITLEVLEYKRPGGFIAPSELKYVISRTLKKEILSGELLTWEHLM